MKKTIIFVNDPSIVSFIQEYVGSDCLVVVVSNTMNELLKVYQFEI